MNSISTSDLTEVSILGEVIPEEVIQNQEDNIEDNISDNTSSKRSHKSEVWDYFNKVEWTKERRAAECGVSNCKKVFSCGSGGTTKPLWRHLESAHRTRYLLTNEYQRKKTKTQKECGTVEEIFRKVNFLLFFLQFFGLF